MATEQILVPSLVFPLGSSKLQDKECRMIYSLGLNACLHFAGFVRSTAQDVIFGPFCLGVQLFLQPRP